MLAQERMSAIESLLRTAEKPLKKIPVPIAENWISQHVASIDGTCGPSHGWLWLEVSSLDEGQRISSRY